MLEGQKPSVISLNDQTTNLPNDQINKWFEVVMTRQLVNLSTRQLYKIKNRYALQKVQKFEKNRDIPLLCAKAPNGAGKKGEKVNELTSKQVYEYTSGLKW